MKKGSRIRRCHVCNDRIYIIEPTGKSVFGFKEMRTKTIKPWIYREGRDWCRECYEKHLEEQAK